MSENTTYNLGRIGLNICGEYDPSATYEKLDVVHYNGSSYVAKTTCTNVLPTVADNWELLAQGEPEVYSLNEVRTNKIWIDGKPIYSKTFKVTSAAAGNRNNYSLGNLGYEMIRVADFTIHIRFNGSGSYWTPGGYYNSTDMARCYISGNQFVIQLGTSVSLYDAAYVTVEYTKTSD